ncbi:MAG: Hsp70 family protein [Proteobacteria bacterium]|nr:Hsp70 family protein [Pseudomonadota bacterium]
MGVAVGIDLGTTNSCVAIVQANRARVVVDPLQRRIYPSIVSFHPDGSTICSHDAKERQIIDPANTIYSFKRLIGRDLSTPEMQRVIEELPYEVKVGQDQIPSIKVQGKEISLPEVSAMMLRHLRELCKSVLGTEITEAVITVPANFNDVQRSLTKVAARIAGFSVLRVLNEPTAAALAYGFGGNRTERIAIYDFGGGTFDITIVELADDIFEVLSTAGNTYLGGDDFDKKIVEVMQKDFRQKHNHDLSQDQMAMQRIRSVAEKAKCQLSSIDEVQATLRDITEASNTSLDFDFQFTRGEFEQLIQPLVEESLTVCGEALKLAGLDRSSIDNLVLVGGTTRIPYIRQRVSEYFNLKPRAEINPDEVVAIGASIQAFSLTGEQLPEHVSLARPRKSAAPQPDMSAALPLVPEPLPSATPQDHALSEISGTTDDNLPEMKEADLEELDLTEDIVFDDDLIEDLTEDEMELSASSGLPAVLGMPEGPSSEAAAPTEELETDLFPSITPPLSEPPPGQEGYAAGNPDPKPIPGTENDEIIGLPSSDELSGEMEVPLDFGEMAEDEGFALPDIAVGAPSALLLDVTPRALGVATAGGFCDTLIERNAAIPVEQSRLFTTSTDNQTEVLINVFQGESRKVADNAHLGQVVLSEIRAARRGAIKVRVTFEIDTDGILGVSARNEETGDAQSTRIVLTGGMPEEQIEALVEKYADDQGS